eukprot:g6657.t1
MPADTVLMQCVDHAKLFTDLKRAAEESGFTVDQVIDAIQHYRKLGECFWQHGPPMGSGAMVQRLPPNLPWT